MRWLFLFVLALNLSYLAWGIISEADDERRDIAPLRNVKPILLLSEAGRQKDVSVSSITEKGSQKKNQTSQDSVELEDVSAAEVASAESTTESTSQSLDAATSQSGGNPVRSSDESKTEQKSAQPKPVASCFTLGPFQDLDKLGKFIREIQPFVTAADFRSDEQEVTVYWVFLRPEKSYEKAVDVGKRLKRKGIKDYYVIRDGDRKHGLSLGHFRNKQGAYGLVNKVGKLGFDVGIEKLAKSKTVYWLDYELVDDTRIPEALFAKYIPQKEKDEVKRLPRECAP